MSRTGDVPLVAGDQLLMRLAFGAVVVDQQLDEHIGGGFGPAPAPRQCGHPSAQFSGLSHDDVFDCGRDQVVE